MLPRLTSRPRQQGSSIKRLHSVVATKHDKDSRMRVVRRNRQPPQKQSNRASASKARLSERRILPSPSRRNRSNSKAISAPTDRSKGRVREAESAKEATGHRTTDRVAGEATRTRQPQEAMPTSSRARKPKRSGRETTVMTVAKREHLRLRVRFRNGRMIRLAT